MSESAPAEATENALRAALSRGHRRIPATSAPLFEVGAVVLGTSPTSPSLVRIGAWLYVGIRCLLSVVERLPSAVAGAHGTFDQWEALSDSWATRKARRLARRRVLLDFEERQPIDRTRPGHSAA